MNFFNICTVLDFITAIIIYIFFLFPKWNKNLYELFIKSCLYVYGFFVLYFTCIIPVIIPIPFININFSQIHVNLVPFIDYIYSRGPFMKQILLNILMLVPFGILYPFIYKKDFKKTITSGLIIIILIELIQLFSVRQFSSCDITDIINNILGVVIGYVIYKNYGKQVKTFLKRLLLDKKIKTYLVSKQEKIIMIVIIIIQLVVRSVIIPFI